MRLLMYRDETGVHTGSVAGEEIINLQALAESQGESLPPDLLGLMETEVEGIGTLRIRIVSAG